MWAILWPLLLRARNMKRRPRYLYLNGVTHRLRVCVWVLCAASWTQQSFWMFPGKFQKLRILPFNFNTMQNRHMIKGSHKCCSNVCTVRGLAIKSNYANKTSWSLFYFDGTINLYRVSHLVVNWVGLTWILDFPHHPTWAVGSCSICPPARRNSPNLSQPNPVCNQMRHPVSKCSLSDYSHLATWDGVEVRTLLALALLLAVALLRIELWKTTLFSDHMNPVSASAILPRLLLVLWLLVFSPWKVINDSVGENSVQTSQGASIKYVRTEGGGESSKFCGISVLIGCMKWGRGIQNPKICAELLNGSSLTLDTSCVFDMSKVRWEGWKLLMMLLSIKLYAKFLNEAQDK